MDDDALHYDSSRVLTASEVGSYLYCNRSWWLDKIGGQQPANVEELALGEALHEAHGQTVARAARMHRAAIAMVAGAALLILAWLVLQFIS
jgi:CRISPR/Cas system-associated exonuclease Cas4 (RecB family)